MKEVVIETQNLTKDYGSGRGIFDVNLKIYKGEMVGFVGTNGSGKTTTIRCLLGFIKPTKGKAFVCGLESWQKASDVAKHVGYVPGEIAFPDLPTGTAFLKSQAEYFKLKDMTYPNQLVERLQLDTRANLKRMSKGMKQKTALVAALMNNAEILILDEPTTGLDPLMRNVFLDIVKDEHKKGKTIFMSSHMFNEVEETCDKVALISDGHLVDVVDMKKIRNRPSRDFKIEFTNEKDYLNFKKLRYKIIRDQVQYNQITINIKHKDINKLFNDLQNYHVKFISEVKYTLEKYFREVLVKQKLDDKQKEVKMISEQKEEKDV